MSSRELTERCLARIRDPQGEGARTFQDHASLAAALRADLRAGVRCLVKGSRGSAMDRIVAALLSTGEDTPHVA